MSDAVQISSERVDDIPLIVEWLSFLRILWRGLKVTACNHSLNLQSGDSVASCHGIETR